VRLRRAGRAARGPLNADVRPHMTRALAVFGLPIMLALGLMACAEDEAPTVVGGPQHVVTCSESLPEFTLGPQSQPTKAQEADLCSCIWARLGNWERRTAQMLVEGKQSEVPDLHMRAFPARLGAAVEECGGMSL